MSSVVEVDDASQEVHAILTAGSLSTPPLVSLSFQGLSEPVALWADLEALGWVVPPRPLRPAVAIEWVGDGPEDFVVKPYRVDDFRIQPGPWPAASRARIGALTVAVLQRHSVRILADGGYLQLIFPAQLAAEQRGDIDLRLPADPLPDTVIIERRADSMSAFCAYRAFGVASGSASEPLIWAERARPVARTELAAQRTVVEKALYAWRVADGSAPEPADIESRSLRLIVPDARTGSELVSKLRVFMGDRVGALALTPMEGSTRTKHAGLLVVGVVAADKIGRVREVLTERHPSIFVRV